MVTIKGGGELLLGLVDEGLCKNVAVERNTQPYPGGSEKPIDPVAILLWIAHMAQSALVSLC
jgi:hypothetical protein